MACTRAEQDGDVVGPRRPRAGGPVAHDGAPPSSRTISSADGGRRRAASRAAATSPSTGWPSRRAPGRDGRHREPIASRRTATVRQGRDRPPSPRARALTNASSSGTARKLVVMACRTGRPGRGSRPMRRRPRRAASPRRGGSGRWTACGRRRRRWRSRASAAPSPSAQASMSRSISRHCSRLVSWNSSTSRWWYRACSFSRLRANSSCRSSRRDGAVEHARRSRATRARLEQAARTSSTASREQAQQAAGQQPVEVAIQRGDGGGHTPAPARPRAPARAPSRVGRRRSDLLVSGAGSCWRGLPSCVRKYASSRRRRCCTRTGSLGGKRVERRRVRGQPVELRRATGPSSTSAARCDGCRRARRAAGRRTGAAASAADPAARVLGGRTTPRPAAPPAAGRSDVARASRSTGVLTRANSSRTRFVRRAPGRGRRAAPDPAPRPQKRAISVSSATSKAGSTSASSGNSRSRPKQNASIVEIWMSDRRVAQRAPDARRRTRPIGRPARRVDSDAIAHLGRGLARERDGQDVARIDAGLEQAHVPIDQHARLARPGRRLEHDVVARIDGEVARRLIGRRGSRLAASSSAIKQARLRHRPRSDIPCGTRRRTRTTAHSAVRCGCGRKLAPPRCARPSPANSLGLRGHDRHRGVLLSPASRPSSRRSSPNARYIAADTGCGRPSRRSSDGLRAVRVHGDLDRGIQVRHAAELVVDDAQRPVAEHVDAVGLAADVDRRGSSRPPCTGNANAPFSSYSSSRSTTGAPRGGLEFEDPGGHAGRDDRTRAGAGPRAPGRRAGSVAERSPPPGRLNRATASGMRSWS